MEPTPDERRKILVNPQCVVCGSQNPLGMQIQFAKNGADAVTATWTPSSAWEGFKGLVHGGILTAVLDAAMSRAVVASGLEALTCEMRVRFRGHVEPGERMHVRGWVGSHRGRKVTAEACMCTPDGDERLHAWATFLVIPRSWAPRRAPAPRDAGDFEPAAGERPPAR